MMRIMFSLLVGTLLLPMAFAQTPEKPEKKKTEPKSKPAKTEAVAKAEPGARAAPPPPAAAAKPEETASEDPLSKIFGEGAWSLQSQRLTTDRDAESGELKTMHIEGGVKIKSDLMNIVCDDLMIDMVKQQMLARGKEVNFEKGDISATCSRLTYDIEDKRTLLEGPPRPIIHQKDPNTGRVTHTNADKITILQNGKADSVILEGRVDIQGEAAPTSTKSKSSEPKPPQKIDNRSADQIPSPTLDGKPS